MRAGAIQRVWLATILLIFCKPALHTQPTAIPHGTVELIAAQNSIQPGHDFQVGLKFVLEKSWHVYWINPGDAGQPPRVAWNLPPELNAGEILWPYPKALPAFSLVDFGYEDEVLLLVPMKTSASLKAATTNLNADIKLIVCQDVCIPGKAKVSLLLPVVSQAPSVNTAAKAAFDATREKLPRPSPAGWKFQATNQKNSFYLKGTVGRPISEAFFFPLEESQIENAAPQKAQPSKSGFGMVLKKSGQLTKPIQHLRGILLLGNKAYIVDAPVNP